MNGAHADILPLLAARPDELGPGEAKRLGEHLAGCQRCAAEAAAYERLLRGLAAMAFVGPEPPAGLLDQLLATVARRRSGAFVFAAAAGSAGALVATVVVARAIHQRRRAAPAAMVVSDRPPLPARAIAAGGDRLARVGRWPRRLRAAPA